MCSCGIGRCHGRVVLAPLPQTAPLLNRKKKKKVKYMKQNGTSRHVRAMTTQYFTHTYVLTPSLKKKQAGTISSLPRGAKSPLLESSPCCNTREGAVRKTRAWGRVENLNVQGCQVGDRDGAVLVLRGAPRDEHQQYCILASPDYFSLSLKLIIKCAHGHEHTSTSCMRGSIPSEVGVFEGFVFSTPDF